MYPAAAGKVGGQRFRHSAVAYFFSFLRLLLFRALHPARQSVNSFITFAFVRTNTGFIAILATSVGG
jgi:hypothetical protein